MGVPQGSILLVTLFSVIINSIAQYLQPGIDCSLYVDDFQICYRSSNMSIIERQLQLCLNKLQQWATDNGFRLSKTKTVCMHICQKRGLLLDTLLLVQFQWWKKGMKEMFYLTTHSTHFIYGYMASDIWSSGVRDQISGGYI